MRAMSKAKRATVQPPAVCMLCHKAIVLHFDHRGRKLDCAQTPTRDIALSTARHKATQLARYIARIEGLSA